MSLTWQEKAGYLPFSFSFCENYRILRPKLYFLTNFYPYSYWLSFLFPLYSHCFYANRLALRHTYPGIYIMELVYGNVCGGCTSTPVALEYCYTHTHTHTPHTVFKYWIHKEAAVEWSTPSHYFLQKYPLKIAYLMASMKIFNKYLCFQPRTSRTGKPHITQIDVAIRISEREQYSPKISLTVIIVTPCLLFLPNRKVPLIRILQLTGFDPPRIYFFFSFFPRVICIHSSASFHACGRLRSPTQGGGSQLTEGVPELTKT